MALKAEVEDIATVEEPFRGLYTEQNGKHVLTGVEGMVPKTQLDAVKTEAGGYRIQLKAANTKLETFKEFGDADALRTSLARIPELEAAAEGKLDDKKIDGIVESRVKLKIAPIERENGLLKTQLGEKDGVINGFKAEKIRNTVTARVTEAARAAKVVDTALEDAVLLGERVFEVLDDGTVVTKEGSGYTPGLAPKDWLSDLQEKRPHWWGPTIGGGAGGSGKGGGGFTGPNPWTAEGWNMTQQGQILMKDRQQALKMAAAAGTTLGGAKPAAKKT